MYSKNLLDNGIRVVTENIPHVRSVSLGVWVNVGARDESLTESGLSHFTEHMLFKGTKNRSAKDIAIEVDSMGGELNAFTSKEGTTYYIKILDEYLPRAVDLLSDIFYNSVFDQKEIDRESKVIAEEIKMVEDTPDDYVHELFYESVWRGTPLGRSVLGTRKSVRSFKRDDFIKFMGRHYLPSDIVIAAAGTFDASRLLDMLNEKFGSKSRKGSKPKDDGVLFTPAVKIKNKKLEQVHICMGVKGLPYGSRERFGMFALNTLLGSSMSSRLFQEIREKHGLAYSIYSYLTSLRDTGLFVIYAGVGSNKAAPVIRLIMKEIDKIRSHGVTADELAKVKEQMKGNMVLAMENTYNRMSQLAKQEMFLGRHYSLDEILAFIEEVDLATIERLVSQTFESGRIALTALGPIERRDLEGELASLR